MAGLATQICARALRSANLTIASEDSRKCFMTSPYARACGRKGRTKFSSAANLIAESRLSHCLLAARLKLRSFHRMGVSAGVVQSNSWGRGPPVAGCGWRAPEIMRLRVAHRQHAGRPARRRVIQSGTLKAPMAYARVCFKGCCTVHAYPVR